MRSSRVDDVGGVVLDVLRDLASVGVAAARGGISERTLRGWVREGRRRRRSRCATGGRHKTTPATLPVGHVGY